MDDKLEGEQEGGQLNKKLKNRVYQEIELFK